MIISRHTRIAANGTVVLHNKSIILAQIVFLVSGAGTTWSIKFQDEASPNPAIIFGPWTAALPSDGKPIILTFTNPSGGTGCPIPITGGLDFVSTGTAGVIDVWTSIHQPSTNA